MKFEELGLNDQLLEALGYMGFESATPIQEQAIPIIKSGKDIIGCAQTGTGKTGAFLIPVLDMLTNSTGDGVKCLIVCPTRELALQIHQQIEGLAYFLGTTSIAIYGGGDGSEWGNQKKALTEGADIVVATPGKLISHINLGYVNFTKTKYLVLDEADRMLDIGFQDDLLKIIDTLPEKIQKIMFSATMPDKIRKFSKRILDNPSEISLSISKPAENVLQAAYLVYDQQKLPLLTQLLDTKDDIRCIVFTSTKKNVSAIVRQLKKLKVKAMGVSSDLEQSEREESLLQFRSGNTKVLVATDVLSRGIDIEDLDMVINYDVPSDAEDYVHRIGRTARAASSGVALTLINEGDMFSFSKIEKLIDQEVRKLVLPIDIGEGPKWKVFQQREKRKSNYKRKPYNKNSKQSFKKKD